MGNILSYLKENGDITFVEKPLRAVDALLLAQFAYFNFDGMVPGVNSEKPAVTLSDIRQHADYQHLFSVNWYKDELRELFELLTASRRFHYRLDGHFLCGLGYCLFLKKRHNFLLN